MMIANRVVSLFCRANRILKLFDGPISRIVPRQSRAARYVDSDDENEQSSKLGRDPDLILTNANAVGRRHRVSSLPDIAL